MAGAVGLDGLLVALLDEARPVFGQVGGILGLVDASGQAVTIAALRGVPASVDLGNRSLPVTAHLPIAEAVRTARPVWLSGAAERADRFPDLARRTPEPYACGSLPLVWAGRTIGVLCLTREQHTHGQGSFGRTERAVCAALSDLAATALADMIAGRSQGGARAVEVYEWQSPGGRLYCASGRHWLLRPAMVADPGAGYALSSVPELVAVGRRVLDSGGTDSLVCQERHLADRGRRLEIRGHLIPGHDEDGSRILATVTSVPHDAPASGPPRAAAPSAAAEGLGSVSAVLAGAAGVRDLAPAGRAVLDAFGAHGLLLIEQHAQRLCTMVSVGRDPADRNWAAASHRIAPTPPDAPATGRVPVFTESTAQLTRRHPQLGPLLDGLGDHAWAVLPLPSADDTLAAGLLAFPGASRPGAAVQTRLLMVAAMLGQALDRCRRHDQHARLAHEMRPDSGSGVWALPAVRVASHYRPVQPGLEVGGDFHETFIHPDGSCALVIGDVQGHGARAAAMARQLRTAVRAYALEGHDPAQMLGRLSRLLADLNARHEDRALYATCCYLALDTVGGGLRMSRAGHPHPIVATDGRPARVLDSVGGPPLGVDPTHAYQLTTGTLDVGSTVLLYTDGLVERPGQDVDDGLRALLHDLDAAHRTDPTATLAALRHLAVTAPRYDDTAVLAARYQPAGGATS